MDSLETLPQDILTRLLADFLKDRYISHFMLSCTSSRLHLIVSKYANERQIPRELNCHLIASQGYLNILKWARYNGYSWDRRTCAEAARNGHFEVLQWACYAGCEWNSDTTINAAESGRLDILMWAKSWGCPISDEICFSATKHGHLEILKWARENGCRGT